MPTQPLMTPVRFGALTLKNRVVMAPLTRCRAIGNQANALMATYYGQRATAGLIISEGISPHPDGLGYARMPGLFTTAQAEAWRASTEAVHAEGGQIVAQLMHSGRVGHPANMPEGARLLGPSAIAAPGGMYTDTEGMQPKPVPGEMTEADIEVAIEAYAHAARLAVEVAGFDGVEIHGANGYLVEQFINVASNQRTDAWGGDVAGRLRFPLAVAKRVIAAIGADRTGIRLSPYGVFNGSVADDATFEVYTTLARELGALKLAYVHVVDHAAMLGVEAVPAAMKASILSSFGPNYILSGGYDHLRANADLTEGKGAAVAFGRPFISNPDLVRKLERGAELRPANQATFYSPGAEGYTDYPVG
jgi:N-ethylmaleimide reductase